MTPESWVICDLDGTLCDMTYRVPLALAKDWDQFYATVEKDLPVDGVAELLRALDLANIRIVVITGRPERTRSATERWIRKHVRRLADVPMYMRGNDDHRPDVVVKKELYEQFCLDRATLSATVRVLFALEDRDRVVQMWRDLGIPCYQVQPGTY